MSSGAPPILVERYLDAFGEVMASEHAFEIATLETVLLERVTERQFLTEFAFAVLISGFRFSTVDSLFDRFSDAFHGFQDAPLIAADLENATAEALTVFNHPRKVATICQAIRDIAESGFDAYWALLLRDWDKLQAYDLVGPATSLHLARNLGMDVAKPDRHMKRLAAALGTTVPTMAEEISQATGDRVAVVDGVLWRFATLHSDFVTYFAHGLASTDTRGPVSASIG